MKERPDPHGQLTWDQFKEAVDRKLAGQGGSGDVPVWYVDVSFPTTHRLTVCCPKDDKIGLSVRT